MMMRDDLTVDFVRSLLKYDANTGVFTWRARRKHIGRAGDIAGTPMRGYLRIVINGYSYLAHRLAWFVTHGEWPQFLDHRDGNRANNAISNLRPATVSENQQNRLRDKLYGSLHRPSGLYIATIRVGGKTVRIGGFKTNEESHQAYLQASLKFHGEFGIANRIIR